MKNKLPIWRSLLFVPAHIDRFVSKAHLRGADAIILDLEDSVPCAEKQEARDHAGEAADQLRGEGVDVHVRINQPWRLLVQDLEVVVRFSVSTICIPKVSCSAQLQFIDDAILELESERKMPEGKTRLIAMIESAIALPQLYEIASASPRLVAMILGSEDFSAAVGMEPTVEGLLYPNQQIIFAARSAGILPLGFVGSIAEYKNLKKFRDTIRFARKLGFRGGFCIHPDQVPIMNEEFMPGTKEVEQARRLIAAYESAQKSGIGAIEHNGKMIDMPVIHRAREILALHDHFIADTGIND